MGKQDQALAKVNSEILKCKICNTNKQGLLVVGEGSSNAEIVFVGEAPGKEEIKTGQPFIGRAGKVLRELIVLAGLKSEDVFITSAVKYLPKTYITPKPKDIEHGRKHLLEQLDVIKPKVIVILGNTAALSLLQQKFSISQSHGTIVKQDGLTYFLSYHPAAPLYSPKLKPIMIKDFQKLKRSIRKN
jgi:uracil-DNA glycosylase family 4